MKHISSEKKSKNTTIKVFFLMNKRTHVRLREGKKGNDTFENSFENIFPAKKKVGAFSFFSLLLLFTFYEWSIFFFVLNRRCCKNRNNIKIIIFHKIFPFVFLNNWFIIEKMFAYPSFRKILCTSLVRLLEFSFPAD